MVYLLEKNKNKLKKGFTLVEMITSVAIFSMVMVIAMGSLMSVLNANKQNQAIQTAVNNLNLAMEMMSREIRVGSVYHCGSDGAITDPKNCQTGGDYLSFKSFEGYQVTYTLKPDPITGYQRIMRKKDDEDSLFLTSNKVVIESLTFYVAGAQLDGGVSDNIQPRALISVGGHVDLGSVGDRGKSYFNLQTTVSQRLIDF